MSYRYGSDPQRDARWLSFLSMPQLNNDLRRHLLAIGLSPDALLAGADVGDVLSPQARDQLCEALSRVSASPAPDFDWPVPVQIVFWGDQDYPSLLSLCPDAPPALFVAGDVALLSKASVAVVGTRSPSAQGRHIADQLGAKLTLSGLSVVSGLARGIDAAVHAATLRAGGSTVAVMATGMDRVYPSGHRDLACDIARSGAVVSEFMPGVAPRRWHFPRRNRTISGMTLGTVVVEAGRPSGSLITANAAAEQGREVFAFPWSVGHSQGQGCLYLLSRGAQLACSANDVLAGVSMERQGLVDLPADTADQTVKPAGGPVGAEAADPVETDLLNCLGDNVVPVDELMRHSGLSPEALLQRLGKLELAGQIEACTGGYRALGPRTWYNRS